MEKLSKEQIVSSVNESLSSFLNENYHDKFKDMDEKEAYRLSKDILNDLRETWKHNIEETCNSVISKTCKSYGLNNDNTMNYCAIVYRYVLAKVVDGYFKAYDENYEPQYNELDITNYKWYDEELDCDLPYEIFYDHMEYVYMPRLELLTDCRSVFVSGVPYDETHLSSIFVKLSELLHEYGYINAPYNDVMAKEID